MGYAVVLGEALIDLQDDECVGQPVYRQLVGGAPLNVAVGVARLGGRVQFVGSVGDDALAGRIRDFLVTNGVQVDGLVPVAAPTALAVATFTGAEPDFRFYGQPPSYGLLPASALDPVMIEQAAVLYCGSITLCCPPALAAARRAWALAPAVRVFDPNVRPALLDGPVALAELRAVVAEFAATAELVKLSAADAAVLYPDQPVERVAARLRERGAAVVVVTCGARGALVSAGVGQVTVAAPAVTPVDTTGAGDSVMAALIADLLADGVPGHPAGWTDRVSYALRVAGLVCESPGGAVAMPTRDRVTQRFGG